MRLVQRWLGLPSRSIDDSFKALSILSRATIYSKLSPSPSTSSSSSSSSSFSVHPIQPFTQSSILLKKKKKLPPPIPPLDEADLIEQFVRGSGPGGQAVNKTNNAVSLIHRPTGIRVQAHTHRSRESNRNQARRTLAERVDYHLNKGHSRIEKIWELERKKKLAKVRRRKRKELEEQERQLRASARSTVDDDDEFESSSTTPSTHYQELLSPAPCEEKEDEHQPKPASPSLSTPSPPASASSLPPKDHPHS